MLPYPQNQINRAGKSCAAIIAEMCREYCKLLDVMCTYVPYAEYSTSSFGNPFCREDCWVVPCFFLSVRQGPVLLYLAFAFESYLAWKRENREIGSVPHPSAKVHVPQVFLLLFSPPELARFYRADSYHRRATQSIPTTFNTSLTQSNARICWLDTTVALPTSLRHNM